MQVRAWSLPGQRPVFQRDNGRLQRPPGVRPDRSPGPFARSDCGLPLILAKQQRFVGQFQRGPDVSAVWTAVTCKIKYCARRGYVDVVNADSDQCHLTQPPFTTSRTRAAKSLSNPVP